MQLTHLFSRNAFTAAILVAVLGVSSHPLQAQLEDLFNQGDALGRTMAMEDPEVNVWLEPANAGPGDVVTLSVNVVLPEGLHTYSMNRDYGGATVIDISDTAGLEPVDKQFTPSHSPEVVFDPNQKKSLEEYTEQVTWTRKYRIPRDADPNSVSIAGELDLKVCSFAKCTPYTKPFRVALADMSVPVSGAGSENSHPFVFEETPEIREKPGPATVRVQISPENAAAGEEVTLRVTVAMQEPWHTYSMTQKPKAATPTTIELEEISGLAAIESGFTPSHAPQPFVLEGLEDLDPLEVHHGEIHWTRRYQVLPGTAAGQFGLKGHVRYQLCTNAKCLSPTTVEFALGELGGPTASATEVTTASTGTETAEQVSAAELPLYLLYAFLGGLILNVMPCVLPVIAIKVMSFVQQAGESRGRILALNVTYAAGVISVFLVLATLAVVVGLGWGGLFRHSGFNLAMACVVFAMGLSLLGVFEIPIPGFVGSAAGSQQQEGLVGAFCTGILATLLATPCSGPFLGTTLGWSVAQETHVTFLVWAVMGVGMASPYLMFGFFPSAIKWLPKPGDWMVRLKEFAGFVLMGTVIFLVSIIDEALTIPSLIMLLGIALGLWMIGNLYTLNSHINHKWTVRVSAAVLTAMICTFGFSLSRQGIELPWQPFSQATANESVSKQNVVLIDFTADW